MDAPEQPENFDLLMRPVHDAVPGEGNFAQLIRENNKGTLKETEQSLEQQRREFSLEKEQHEKTENLYNENSLNNNNNNNNWTETMERGKNKMNEWASGMKDKISMNENNDNISEHSHSNRPSIDPSQQEHERERWEKHYQVEQAKSDSSGGGGNSDFQFKPDERPHENATSFAPAAESLRNKVLESARPLFGRAATKDDPGCLECITPENQVILTKADDKGDIEKNKRIDNWH